MKTAIIFDCEFLVTENAQRRFWCGPYDPDPVIAQIGAVKLGLEGDFPILDTTRIYVKPMDRDGNRFSIDPFFTKLTGISEQNIEQEGVSLHDALNDVNQFSDGAQF